MSQLKRFTRRAAIAFLAVAVTLAFGTADAHAATPGTVFVEGYLHATGSGPVSDGNYAVTFALYGSKTAVKAMWAEGPVTIAVKGGRWSYPLGAKTPIKAGAIAGATTLWLGLKIASDPELPRMRVHSAFYAQAAGTAAGISCTGCVSIKALKADGALDLGANSVKAKEFIGDGSKLTGIIIPAGQCASGKVVTGIDKSGKLICGSASPLPDDGVDKVSQGLIAVVGDLYLGNLPVNINDNNPKGSESKTTLKNVGKVDKLTVSVGLKITSGNSGINKLRICLIGPGGSIPSNAGFTSNYCTAKLNYLLHDKTGAGKTLLKTWPSPTKEVKGNIAEWIGGDPSGTWTLQVVDTNFDTNKVIGTIDKFVISARTTGNNKINIGKELVVDGEAKFNKGFVLGYSTQKCSTATEGLVRYNKTSKELEFCNASEWRTTHKQGGSIFRWNVWSTYSQGHGQWYAGNSSTYFGGIAPSTWGDGNGRAHQFSSTTDILKTLFWRKGPRIDSGMKNAMVYAHEWKYYSSTNSRHVGVLFRIRNTTGNSITWKPCWYRTAYGGWSERASISLNGANNWESGGSNYGAHSSSCHSLSIPKNRTSTIIFVNASSSPSGTRACFLTFYNNCLTLPTGLVFVDDLDTKPNGFGN